MKTYRFNYNIQLAHDLRDAVNERQNLSLEKEHTQKNNRSNVTYIAWDRICTIMDRLEDTIDYVNGMELGNCRSHRAAFDFYEFINCSAIIIDCIKTMGMIFNIDIRLIEEIEKSQEIFGTEYSITGTDQRFFEYIRSLCVVHPLFTNHQKEYLSESKFHCCPFVVWSDKYGHFNGCENSDLMAVVYTSQEGSHTIWLPLYLEQFDKYLGKWIDLIPRVIEAKDNYTDDVYEQFRNEPIKDLSDFDNDAVNYLIYLKEEYGKRFGDLQDSIFDEYIRIFRIRLSDKNNEYKLEK